MAMIHTPNGNDFEEVSLLGTGAFGMVRLCKHIKSGSEQIHNVKCVVKKVKLARQGPKERFASAQELALMLQLRHRNLVRGIDAWVEGQHTACLAMAHCDGGDLTTLLHKHKDAALDEHTVCVMFVQVRTSLSRSYSVAGTSFCC